MVVVLGSSKISRFIVILILLFVFASADVATLTGLIWASSCRPFPNDKAGLALWFPPSHVGFNLAWCQQLLLQSVQSRHYFLDRYMHSFQLNHLVRLIIIWSIVPKNALFSTRSYARFINNQDREVCELVTISLVYGLEMSFIKMVNLVHGVVSKRGVAWSLYNCIGLQILEDSVRFVGSHFGPSCLVITSVLIEFVKYCYSCWLSDIKLHTWANRLLWKS